MTDDLQTIINNELLGRFLELPYDEKYWVTISIDSGTTALPSWLLKFDTDWKWLMSVIAKIHESGLDFDDYKILRKLRDDLVTGDIELIYPQVVEIVKWITTAKRVEIRHDSFRDLFAIYDEEGVLIQGGFEDGYKAWIYIVEHDFIVKETQK